MTSRNANEVTTPHKQWLDNEYQQWIKALSECTVHNFKEHPGVRRMLSLNGIHEEFEDYFRKFTGDYKLINKIETIGYPPQSTVAHHGSCGRYIYYAQQILALNPSSIVEIGGGVGQFYATLRALGYSGRYWIFDLPEAREFQYEYLAEVNKATGLMLIQHSPHEVDLLVSFYALGEFDDATKESYRSLIERSPHGYIAWNPHSGANDDLSIFDAHKITVTPGVEEGVKIISW